MKKKPIIKKLLILLWGLYGLLVPLAAQSSYPMGYTDEDMVRCFREFVPVEFAAKYKWVTRGKPKDPQTDQNMPETMAENNAFDGQQTPLVGDLNGDGKPEIITVSLDANSLASYTATNMYLYILNGQNGHVILKYPLPSRTYSKGMAYHGTPCQIVLYDVDRNGKAEIIVALGGYYDYANTTVNNFKWSKRLVCYEVNDATFSTEYTDSQTPATTSSDNMARLTLKWVSDKRYDWNSYAVITPNVTGNNFNAVPAYTFSDAEAGGPGKGFTDGGGYCYSNYTYRAYGGGEASLTYFSSPTPQIVDLDGQGNLGILVYNKVYDAANGKLLVELEHLNPANSNAVYYASAYTTSSAYAFTGRDKSARNDGGGYGGDTNFAFAAIYDFDGDGKMDIAAGGKVYYNIDWGNPNLLANNLYSVLKDIPGNGLYSNTATEDYVGDGRTTVADINDDGIAEIIVLGRKPGDSGNSGTILLTAYNPGFFTIVNGVKTPVGGAPTPTVVAQVSIPLSYVLFGNLSIPVIGDLDKLEQNGHKYPEISFMSGDMYADNADDVPLHPNVAASLRTKLVAGTGSANAGKYHISSSGDGQMLSFTYDNTEADVTKRFKVSFILLHTDTSDNTSFTLFDFDNNGTQDICYRDSECLRIISPASPHYVNYDDTPTSNSMIKFRIVCLSWTGYECPVIADVDGDGSADIIVHGGTSRNYWTDLYCIEAYNTQFAPCPPVWNQYTYNPLRIMEDLKYPNETFDPLDPAFNYITDKNNPTDREWIYNNSMTQISVHSLFKVLNPTIPSGSLTGTAADSIVVMAPIMKEPDIKVWANTVALTASTGKLQIYITNTGSAALNGSYPIVIYETSPNNINSISSATKRDVFPVGTSVYPGDTLLIEYTIRTTAPSNFTSTSPNNDYIIRVSDANYANYQSSSAGTFQPDGKRWKDDTYLECNWADNWCYTSAFMVQNDVFTLQPYEHISFNVLTNDARPSTCSSAQPVFLQSDQQIANAELGTRVTTSAGGVSYTAPPACSDGVIDMGYSLTCSGTTKTGHIYIYLLENQTGEYAACYNTNITVGAKEQPSGTYFNWLSANNLPISDDGPGTFLLRGDTTFYVTPHPPTPYDEINFPQATVTVYTVGSTTGTQDTIYWLGSAGDGSWNNPNNWGKWDAELGDYVPTHYAPDKCTDAYILHGTDVYPKLDKPGGAGKIHMEDRSMLANTHLLDYDSVSLAVKFTADERNRWVMYSSPLRRIYSGDFMLRNSSGVPLNGSSASGVSSPAVYMSLFQSDYPDPGSITAQARAFTQPFGKLDVPLPLGKAFNVWIDADVDTDTPFRFPSPLNQYDYWVHYPGGQLGNAESTGELLRTDGANNNSGNRINGRFIIEDVTPTNTTTGQFAISGSSLGDAAGYSYLMVPNPFMAYLDMAAFLTTNADVLQNHYKVWDGATGTFISYQLYAPDLSYPGGTWWISSAPANWDAPVGTTRYTAPLQAFIVEKQTPADVIGGLTYIPQTMTNTVYDAQTGGDYALRSAQAADIPEGLLYITAEHGAARNSTVLVNAPKSTNSYTGEDVAKLTLDNEDGQLQLSVYTLTPEQQALDINLSSDFDDKEIPVGIRTNISGDIRLNFPGAAAFGHKVYFRDGSTLIDLSENPACTVSVTNNGASKFYEINDRFALKFGKSGEGIAAASSSVRIQTAPGKILIWSDTPMEAVEALSASGQNMFKTSGRTCFQAIEVDSKQVYIVRITTANGVLMRKVIVK
ncbi:MAG: VCBS repeat-containing protein [Prevotella sp.]|jgi:hypothetical protein|nr:VCBS repeat-containing protein [Prevotella sp.]